MTGSTDRPGRVPDFFIVGHPKCGTTALYEMLRSHPAVFMPELKETRFFSRELHPNTPAETHPQTLEQYLALFAPAEPGQRAGEASPSYLRSEHAAQRIAHLAPDARIVAILREPAGFLNSLHMELMRDHVETEKDLARALADEPRRRAEIASRPGLVYADYVRYVEQLRRYHDAFGRERVLVLIYDDFRAENEATVRRVLAHIGVEDAGPLALAEANPSVRVRSPRMNELVRSLYLGRGPLARAAAAPVKALVPQRLRRRGLEAFQRRAVYGAPKPPDPELMLELRRRYRGEVAALSDYLGRDLVRLWGYDGID
ncbi:MAG TPA: sulfotransferase [Solirubrobacteraceae bacterium]|nr:sulfotransferase [Solirubrobacteraceae bacterium]